MPYTIRKQKCKQSDGDSGGYTLSYTDNKGKKHRACHTSKKKARGQIAAIEGPRESVEMPDADIKSEQYLAFRHIIRQILVEARIENYGIPNTIFSDMNEILMASSIMGGTTVEDVAANVGEEAAALLNSRIRQVKLAVRKAGGTSADANNRIDVELRNGLVSAEAVLDWAASHGYGSSPRAVFWTARPGGLESAMAASGSKKTPTPGHPADVAVVFGRNKVLGVSAKATKGTGDIGFKNPGWGTIAAVLGIQENPADIVSDSLLEIDPELVSLPSSARKIAIRADASYAEAAAVEGQKVLKNLRDILLSTMTSMDEESLRDFVINELVDAPENIIPPYIKVTATGGGASAHVHDPMSNPMLDSINAEGLSARAARNDSIVFFSSANSAILQLRVKFESQPLASSIKMSAEPASKKSA